MASGRNFGPADDAQAPGVAIINESLARAYFKGEEPIGRRLRISARAGNAERVTFTIVGVVRDYRDRALDQEPRATYYLPLAQFPVNDVSFTLRAARSSPAALVALAAGFRQAITEIDREQAVDAVRTLEEVVSSSMAGRRFPMQLLALFAALSLLLAAIGIYGVMSYAVEQRTHELGVRRAVGATAEAVMRLVVGQGLRLAALGIAIGTAVGLALSRVIAGLLFGVSATDPLTFAGIALLLLLVALAACWLPARRAAAVDPMVALRTE